MSHWYAIQVTSGKEESTCRLMRRLVPSAVLEEVFTPRYETQKKYQGEWRMCPEPSCFPAMWWRSRQTSTSCAQGCAACRSLRGFSPWERPYLPLDEHDRAWIEALTRKGARTVEMSTAVMEGDHVVVTGGPLMGHEGWICAVNRQKSLAFLEIEMFGRKLKTKVGLAILSRQSVEEDAACK